MLTFEEAEERDFAAYEALKETIHAQYQGKFVAIAGGRVVCVAPTIEEARAAVAGFEHRLVFAADAEVQRGTVWIRRHRRS